jgi:hypothetical protein
VCLFRLGQYVVDQLDIEQPLRNRSAVDGGVGPEANRVSVRL